MFRKFDGNINFINNNNKMINYWFKYLSLAKILIVCMWV